MLIDWFTVGAQALNFLVLVLLLKRVLYKPILAAIEARELKVSSQLAEAADQDAKAQREVTEFKTKNDEFDRQRSSLLERATADANTEGKRLLDAARAAAEVWRTQRQLSMQADAKSINEALSLRIQQQVFTIARRALADMATTSLEARLSELFCQRLRAMPSAAQARFSDALKTSADSARIRSAFALSPEQRTVIEKALNDTFTRAVEVHYETVSDVIAGVELTAGGQRVCWSLDTYLSDLEQSIQVLVTSPNSVAHFHAKPVAVPAPLAVT